MGPTWSKEVNKWRRLTKDAWFLWVMRKLFPLYYYPRRCKFQVQLLRLASICGPSVSAAWFGSQCTFLQWTYLCTPYRSPSVTQHTTPALVQQLRVTVRQQAPVPCQPAVTPMSWPRYPHPLSSTSVPQGTSTGSSLRTTTPSRTRYIIIRPTLPTSTR